MYSDVTDPGKVCTSYLYFLVIQTEKRYCSMQVSHVKWNFFLSYIAYELLKFGWNEFDRSIIHSTGVNIKIPVLNSIVHMM